MSKRIDSYKDTSSRSTNDVLVPRPLVKNPFWLDIPIEILECKALRGIRQKQAVAYILFRISIQPYRRFNSVELATLLGISRQGAWKMCLAFAKRSIFQDRGNKRMDTDPRLHSYGLTYITVHEFTANLEAINTLLYKKSETKSLPTIIEVISNKRNTPLYNKSIPAPDTIKEWIIKKMYGESDGTENDLMRQWIKEGREDIFWRYVEIKDPIYETLWNNENDYLTLVAQEYEYRKELFPDPELDDLRQQWKTIITSKATARAEAVGVAEKGYYETIL